MEGQRIQAKSKDRTKPRARGKSSDTVEGPLAIARATVPPISLSTRGRTADTATIVTRTIPPGNNTEDALRNEELARWTHSIVTDIAASATTCCKSQQVTRLDNEEEGKQR